MGYLAAILLVAISFLDIFAERKLPDYSNWHSREYSRPYLLEGRGVELLEKSYETIDLDTKLYKAVAVIHNENKNPWLILYVIVPGEFLNGHGLREDFTEAVSMFEHVNKSWKFVNKFSVEQTRRGKFLESLKEKYKLEHK